MIMIYSISMVLSSNCPLLYSLTSHSGVLHVNKTVMMSTGLPVHCQWLIASTPPQVGQLMIIWLSEYFSFHLLEYCFRIWLYYHSYFDERIFTYGLSTWFIEYVDCRIKTSENSDVWWSTKCSNRWNWSNVNDWIGYHRSEIRREFSDEISIDWTISFVSHWSLFHNRSSTSF